MLCAFVFCSFLNKVNSATAIKKKIKTPFSLLKIDSTAKGNSDKVKSNRPCFVLVRSL
jgi:hypothetical protein